MNDKQEKVVKLSELLEWLSEQEKQAFDDAVKFSRQNKDTAKTDRFARASVCRTVARWANENAVTRVAASDEVSE